MDSSPSQGQESSVAIVPIKTLLCGLCAQKQLKACHHSEDISHNNSALPAGTFNIFLVIFLTETLVRHKHCAAQLGGWGQS